MKILFCSNELLLTGAPLILTEFIENMPQHEWTVYSSSTGPLESRLSKVAKITHDLVFDGHDLIIANTVCTFPAVELAKKNDIPCIWYIHESNPSLHNIPKHIYQIMNYPVTIFPCYATQSVYQQYIDRTEVIPTIVAPFRKWKREESRKYLNLKDEFVIINVGTIEKRKGQEDLVKAIKGLPVKCFMVGRNTYDLNGEEATITGEVENVHPYYGAADLYVCCSRVEAFPRTILEAAEYGLPIITTPAFGIREQIFNNINGIFYRPGRIEELKEKIQSIMNSKKKFKPLNHLPSYEEVLIMFDQVIHTLVR